MSGFASDVTRDRFEGCLLGLALGDALGAPFEGGPLERLLWRFIGKTDQGEMRWTDDTQMSLDLAESLIAHGVVDCDALAMQFAMAYRWSRGYGAGAAKLLKLIARGTHWREANRSIFADGSFGNGGAMRAPVVGLYYACRPTALAAAARESACITHAHPLGMEGAVLIASATATALSSSDSATILRTAANCCQLAPFKQRLALAQEFLDLRDGPEAHAVRASLGNGIAAVESCVTAIYIALRFLNKPFGDMHAFTVACGGDVDTIGAMAGAVWGAANGAAALPAECLQELEQRARLQSVSRALYERSIAETAASATTL